MWYRGPARIASDYMAVITLLRTLEILVLRRPRVTTTAMVMTPRTTAYSAIVWPDSSLRSANRRLRYSIKEFTSFDILRDVAPVGSRPVWTVSAAGPFA